MIRILKYNIFTNVSTEILKSKTRVMSVVTSSTFRLNVHRQFKQSSDLFRKNQTQILNNILSSTNMAFGINNKKSNSAIIGSMEKLGSYPRISVDEPPSPTNTEVSHTNWLTDGASSFDDEGFQPCKKREISLRSFITSLGASVVCSFLLGSAARSYSIEQAFRKPQAHGARFGRLLLSLDNNKGQTESSCAAPRVQATNQICNSSIEQTTRHLFTLRVENVPFTQERAMELLLHPRWADKTLSYHCQTVEEKGDTHCISITRGGGSISISFWPSRGDVNFSFFSGCGLLWKGSETTNIDIEEFTIFVTDFVMHDDPEYLKQKDIESETGGILINRAKTAFQVRGYEFRETDLSGWDSNKLYHDLGSNYLIADDIYKMKVATVQTDFQSVDIYDFIESSRMSWDSYAKANGFFLSNKTTSYEREHPELFKPERIVFLDGVIQSTSYGDEAYHEALVHPGMFAHPNPKRAAIIGGGEGATLREILKHDTIEEVYMIEIDPKMVEACKIHLPQWNSCKDIVGSTDSCFDEPRASIYFEDAMAWFIQRFGNVDEYNGDIAREADSSDDASSDDDDEDDEEEYEIASKIENEKQFDIIIMDALDPSDNVDFADVLYNSDIFFYSLYNGLTDDGILIMQLGEVSSINEAPDEYTAQHRRANLIIQLEKLGFEKVHQYQEVSVTRTLCIFRRRHFQLTFYVILVSLSIPGNLEFHDCMQVSCNM